MYPNGGVITGLLYNGCLCSASNHAGGLAAEVVLAYGKQKRQKGLRYQGLKCSSSRRCLKEFVEQADKSFALRG